MCTLAANDVIKHQIEPVMVVSNDNGKTFGEKIKNSCPNTYFKF